MSKPRPSPPTKPKICQYWCEHRPEDLIRLFEFLPDPEELRYVCWACHIDTERAQICHLIPFSRGGSTTPENLVLLCYECHHLAPSVNDDGRTMIEWMADKPRWCDELVEDVMAARDEVAEPEALLAFQGRQTMPEEVREIVRHLVNNVESHAGRISRPTRRWLLREAFSLFREVAERCGVKP